jgi:hypothetical protein
MKDLDTQLEEILKPYFAKEVDMCADCNHLMVEHMWIGSDSGKQIKDQCKVKGCKCLNESNYIDHLIEYDDYNLLKTQIKALFREMVEKESLKKINEKEQNKINKDDPDEHAKWWSKGWNSGYNFAITDYKQNLLSIIEEK